MTENRDNFNETYNALIERIVNLTLEGKIRAKSQVYNLLAEAVKNGTGEIFERCLTEKIIVTRSQLETKIKATRVLRALETIESEWEKYQKTNQQILLRLLTNLKYIYLNRQQWSQTIRK